jgi:hypothetical protein
MPTSHNSYYPGQSQSEFRLPPLPNTYNQQNDHSHLSPSYPMTSPQFHHHPPPPQQQHPNYNYYPSPHPPPVKMPSAYEDYNGGHGFSQHPIQNRKSTMIPLIDQQQAHPATSHEIQELRETIKVISYFIS